MSEEARDEAGSQGAAPDAAAVAAPAPLRHNTQVQAQVTSDAAPARDDGGKWCCEVCTYQNFPLSRKCTMCRSAKPLLGEDIFRLQDGAAALPPAHPAHPADHDVCGAAVAAAAERLRPLRIASPPPPSASACARAAPKWACATCTYENWPKAQKCAMCGLPAPAATPAHPAPAPVPTPAHNDSSQHNVAEAVSQSASLERASQRRNNVDWLWLQACLGVLEGSARRVEAYLAAGGDPARALTSHEVQLLDRASAFDAGHTLVHLAIRFQRQDILPALLARISGGGPGLKRSPSYVAPDLATAIRRQLEAAVRHKRGGGAGFPATYLNEFATFALPAEIEELSPAIQEQLFSELLDRDAQQTLEGDPPLVNWSLELTERLGSRVFALWNRSRGDCLPDALCQAAYGVFDRNNTLRAALADTLHHAHRLLYDRWQAWERLQASLLQYAPDEAQLRAEWARLVTCAARPGTPLRQLHVFALAHVMRRPIIVYGVNVVNSFRGEALGYAHFQGVYLPLLWEPEFCSKSPLCLGYTRGHFSALVPLAGPPAPRRDPPAHAAAYLPLTDCDGKLLPVHFLSCMEMSDEEGVLRRWLSAVVTRGGQLAAKQTLHSPSLLVAQLLQEHLNHYRRLQQQTCAPFLPRLQPAAADLSSDPDTDDE